MDIMSLSTPRPLKPLFGKNDLSTEFPPHPRASQELKGSSNVSYQKAARSRLCAR
jgi:hypothetical protein